MANGTFLGWKTHATGYRFGHIEPDGAEGDRARNIYIKDAFVANPNSLKKGARVEFEVRELPDGRQQASKIEVLYDADSASAAAEAKRLRGVVRFYNDATKFGFIDGEGGQVHIGNSGKVASFGVYLRAGDVVEYSVEQSERGLTAIDAKRVGFEAGSENSDHFHDHFEFSNVNWKEILAEKDLAESEPWDYRLTKGHTEFPILESYLSHTFRRLLEMDKGVVRSKDENLLAFNTGLVTENQEEIYGFARKLEDPSQRPWKLVRWVKRSDREFISAFGDRMPPLAEFFDDPAELIFDRRIDLHINIDHVLARLDRFPPELQKNEYTARQLLIAAEAETKKRAYRNYKVAIPQFFRDKGGPGRLQLLLPICLTTPKKADLALTVEKNKEKTAYLSSTVLTLDQAYNNARLLARPDREWLEP
jgi:cold shock CspA family protein